MSGYHIAVVGATGLVGRTMLRVLEERKFPVRRLSAFASSRSAGETLEFRGKECIVQELKEDSFTEDMDIALFSAGAAISAQFAPLAAARGIDVVDNSSQWRMKEEIPLVVPEVNPEDLSGYQGIIANPNCSTIQCMPPLKVLRDLYGLKRVIFSTYQAAAGAGMKGLEDLKNGTKHAFDHVLKLNVLPRIDAFLENGYTKEEMKMIDETRKILHLPKLAVTATAVRVPVDFGHSISVNVELENDFILEDVRHAMQKQDGIILEDDPENLIYPYPELCKGNDAIYVGRIRRDESCPNTLNFFCVADNIRKGAATNSVQIAELLVRGRL